MWTILDERKVALLNRMFGMIGFWDLYEWNIYTVVQSIPPVNIAIVARLISPIWEHPNVNKVIVAASIMAPI